MRTRTGGAGVAGGIVFGRALKTCVFETAVSPRIIAGISEEHPALNREDIRDLETRRLCALVVRAAQHILTWGVQEEGLFRYVFALTPV
jgi:hypothetical protein